MNSRFKRVFRTRTVVISGILGALTAVLGFTIGFVPFPTPVGAATILHVPVIIAGIVEGPIAGGIVGALFGLSSWYRAVLNPAPQNIPFLDPFIAIPARILIGIISHYAFIFFKRSRGKVLISLAAAAFVAQGVFLTLENTVLALVLGAGAFGLASYLSWRFLSADETAPAAAAILGSMTNTVGVLGMIVLRGYLPVQVASGIAVAHGLPEMFIAVVVVLPVYKAVKGFVEMRAGKVE